MQHYNIYKHYPTEAINGDRNHCTVMAVMVAFEISFGEAQLYLRKHCGRVKGRGIDFEDKFPSTPLGKRCTRMVFKGRRKLGRNTYFDRHAREEVECDPNHKMMYLEDFANTYNEGSYIVLVRGHALAVVDGVVYDHSKKPRRQVKFAFKVGE